ncbi:MAG: hypothetical protein A2857_00305 [Candidatus Levybacteria bacterium RIFCSPHIGHO2_01_FULL_36_15]|nr:MAG: hypothetical protein A2857_00305 [Candidatus Levybacteria bacterium RIFCSPHIGHO2_01_FULL_36_15]
MSNYVLVKDLISEKITGEWGLDPISDHSIGVIRTTNFTNEGKLNLDKLALRNVSNSKVAKKKLIQGDVIIEKSGGSPTQPVGRVVYFDVSDGKDYLCNNFTSILRPSSDIYSKYLFYGLYFLHISKKTLAYQNKTTGIINLQLDRYLSNEKINLPSIDEQKNIVETLDKADLIYQKRKQTVDLLDEYLKSVFLEMFGDPMDNSKNWEKKSLKQFGEVITGNTPPRNNIGNYSSEFIEWIKTDNIVANKIYLSTATEYLSETGLKRARFVKPGAILVACIAGSIESIGRAAITNREVSFNQQINAIQPNDKINSVFLYWLFKFSKLYIQNQATRGMKKILTKGAFERIMMITPPIDLQNEFVATATKVDVLKSKMLSQSDILEVQFHSLMQKSFSIN